MAWIYISSTYEDLKDERDRVAGVLRTLGHKAIGMEDYPASDQRPLDKCLADIGECDAYVGIFANRYGYVPSGHGGKSITQLEFEEATRLRLKRFIFLIESDTSTDARLRAFKQQLRDSVVAAHWNWKDLSHLGEKVATAIGADRELAAGTQLPALLPYLCDRSPQMSEFRDAFHRSLGSEGPGQPLVVLVHGDEREAHSRFLERVKVHVIPKLYQPVGRRTAALSPVRLDWPADLVKREQFYRRMEGMLADRLEVAPTREAVLQRLTSTPGLVFAEVQLLTSECRRSGTDTIAHFVGFWDDLLRKSPVPLMVALSVKYTRPGLFSMGLRSFNSRVTARLNQLALERWQTVGVKVLPELKAVVQSDALSWADHEDIRRYCRRSLEPEVRKLYDGWGDTEGMPMEELAQRLTEMLQRHSRREKDHDRPV